MALLPTSMCISPNSQLNINNNQGTYEVCSQQKQRLFCVSFEFKAKINIEIWWQVSGMNFCSESRNNIERGKSLKCCFKKFGAFFLQATPNKDNSLKLKQQSWIFLFFVGAITLFSETSFYAYFAREFR